MPPSPGPHLSLNRDSVLMLHAFGGAFVARDGVALGGAAAQRRLLALLSVLAVHRDTGISRDRLLAMLWPEADAERARHALTQALYNARRALGCDDLFITMGDLRLHPDRLASDAGRLLEAAERQDWQVVSDTYRGAFLDGFFITGAPEFEHWVAMQRTRFASMAAGALDRLADAAAARGDVDATVLLRRRRVELDPLDSGAVAKLMTSLDQRGDTAAALQHARVHEAILRQSLDVELPPTIATLVTQLRQRPAALVAVALGDSNELRVATSVTASAVESPRHAIAEPNDRGVVGDPQAAGDARVTATQAPVPGQMPPRRFRARTLIAATAGLAAIATLGVLATTRVRSGPALTGEPVLHGETVVVAPFRVAGADASLAYLREGIVELLSMRLMDDSSARAVDPGAVLNQWRAAGLLDVTDVPRSDAARVASRLGARTVVVGSVIGTPAKLVVSASLVGVPDGDVRVSESVEGPADSVSMLVDRLAGRLLAADAGEGERLDGDRPPPLAALRAYLRGQAAYRRGHFSDAVGQYEQALASDSTFALAALRLALAADRMNAAEQHDRALSVAWTHRSALGQRDLAHLIAFAGPRYPSPSPEAEQLAAWERAALLAPDRAEVWQELGERFFYDGAVVGLSDWRQRATAAFRRTLALDPDATTARAMLILAAARAGDTAALARDATPIALRDSVGPLRPFLTWRVALARADETTLRGMRDMFPRFDATNLRAVAMSSLFDAVGVADGERALRIRRALATRVADEVDVLLAQHTFALNQGRPVLALDLTEQLQEIQPGTRAHLRLRVLDALYAHGDRAAAREAALELARVTQQQAPTPDRQAVQLADLCVLEQWRVAQGDRRATTRVIARLRAAGSLATTVPVATPPLACAELLSALRAVGAREPGALAQVQRLDSLMLTGPAVSDAATYAHLVVASQYERLGEPLRALDAIRRRGYMSGWPRYLAASRREEGRLALAAGDTLAAVEVFRRYLALRGDPESEVIAGDAAIRRLVNQMGPRVAELAPHP